jgi:hypothetical protein
MEVQNITFEDCDVDPEETVRDFRPRSEDEKKK